MTDREKTTDATNMSPISSGAFFDAIAKKLAESKSRRSALTTVFRGLAAAVLADIGVRPAWAASCFCGNYLFDSNTQCCTPSGIQQKYPMPSTSACPNRVPHVGYIPEVNGCGGQNSWSGTFIPNSFGTANFTNCCNSHDACYGTCNSTQYSCDSTFNNCLAMTCFQAYPFYWQASLQAACLSIGNLYYYAVSVFGGTYFESGQRQACDCCGTTACPPPPCSGSTNCMAAPSCNGSSVCGCLSVVEGAFCARNISCTQTYLCYSSRDCPSGWGCTYYSCCPRWGGGYCAPPCGSQAPAAAAVQGTQTGPMLFQKK